MVTLTTNGYVTTKHKSVFLVQLTPSLKGFVYIGNLYLKPHMVGKRIKIKIEVLSE